ncbi:alpha-glucosidase C-terminal domain-containing protein [Caloramator sp. mosi_1]|nr:alpha-glucosidase C-terminal domain-containing protein [Caloramator sp. mosi_1]WDC85542.1 alpha-glucosidase C-terminal domain-containing protein [Caloramator sp. mosi_1]
MKFINVKNDNVLVFLREKEDNRVLVFANLSDKEVNLEVPLDGYAGKYKDFYSNETVKLMKNQTVKLSAWGYVIYVK